MSITDELRNWSRRWSDTRSQSLYEVADRIDEAHDKAKICEINKAYDNIAATYIKLPKDKNGKTVLIGDMVKSWEHRGSIREVIGIRLSEKVNVWSLEFHVSEGGSVFSPANRCELVEPDSQEKIDADVRSIADEWCDQSCDTSGSKQCLHDGIQDLLRRQRTLDGVK